MNTINSPTLAETHQLTVSRVFDAPRELVWRAWTDPQLFTKWMVPAEGMTAVLLAPDLRPGGKYRIEFKGAEGESVTVGGTYREVVAPERLVFTWGHQGD